MLYILSYNLKHLFFIWCFYFSLNWLLSCSSSSSSLLEHLQVLAMLKLGILLAQYPGEHLSCLHAGQHYAAALIPMSRRAAIARTLENDGKSEYLNSLRTFHFSSAYICMYIFGIFVVVKQT